MSEIRDFRVFKIPNEFLTRKEMLSISCATEIWKSDFPWNQKFALRISQFMLKNRVKNSLLVFDMLVYISKITISPHTKTVTNAWILY